MDFLKTLQLFIYIHKSGISVNIGIYYTVKTCLKRQLKKEL